MKDITILPGTSKGILYITAEDDTCRNKDLTVEVFNQFVDDLERSTIGKVDEKSQR